MYKKVQFIYQKYIEAQKKYEMFKQGGTNKEKMYQWEGRMNAYRECYELLKNEKAN